MKRFALALIFVLTAASAIAAERHTGHVVAVDPTAGTLRLDELVQGVGAETRAVERTLRLAPTTTIQLVQPAAALADARWPDTWQRQPLRVEALKPGDFVTVTTAGDSVVAMDVVRP